MITELNIEGFKSFGSPAETIELGPLNFVVGANASGKTNLLSALRFLQSAVVHDVSYATSEMGGKAEVRNKRLRQRNTLKPIRLSLKLKKAFQISLTDNPEPDNTEIVRSMEYDLVIDLRSGDDTVEIDREVLRAERVWRGDTSEVGLDRYGRTIEIVPRDGRSVRIPENESTRLGLVGVGFVSLPAMFLREEIRGWRFHNIVPDVARQPCRDERSAALGPAGEKLASILHRMSDEDRNGISHGLRAIVPGLREVETRLSMDGTLTFRILEDKLKTGINPGSASDGTVRLLALLVATTWSVRNSTLITIEEPENGVHPHLAEYIVGILRSASEHSQIVVTTHAPDLLDHLEPHEVILCDKEDGFTKLRKASSVNDIEQFRKHFSLGELWSQGAVGAIP